MSAKELRAILTAGWRTDSVYAFAALGLADELAAGPLPCDVLARRVGARSTLLYRLLRALSTINVVSESDPGVFALAPVGEMLRSDKMRDIALLYGGKFNQTMRHLAQTVCDGETGFEKQFGQPLFGGYMETHPELAELLDRAMACNTSTQAQVLVESIDIARFGSLVDIGGGIGILITEAVRRNPVLQGMVLELPGVVERGRLYVREQGLEQRIQFVEGSMFEEVPVGADGYILKLVLHDWKDEKCVEILRAIARVMKPESRLLVIEDLIAERWDDSREVIFLDLFMMSLTGGAERTEAEYMALFAAAGLEHRTTRAICRYGVSYHCLEAGLR